MGSSPLRYTRLSGVEHRKNPPGRNTRRTSSRNRSCASMCSMVSKLTTASTDASASGIASQVPSTNRRPGVPYAPAA